MIVVVSKKISQYHAGIIKISLVLWHDLFFFLNIVKFF